MNVEDTSTPATVLVCHRQVGIGVVRSLGRLGAAVYCIDNDRNCPAFLSKYCRGQFVWDLHSAPVEESMRLMTEVGQAIGRRSVLIPASDVGAMFVAEQADRLRKWFIFPERDPSMVRSLCSKKEMYHLARKWNMPTPATVFPQSRTDVLDYLEIAHFPILLKPIYSRLPGIKPWQMTLVHTERQLIERYDAVEDKSMPNVMLQEYIPGGDEMTWTFNGYFDKDGECRVAFTGRKLRNFPPYFGAASLAICARNERVESMTVDFMKAIGYRGALDLGYRYDVRDAQYKLNDVNPRIGAMFRLFVSRSGMDVARALYLDMTDQPVVSATAQERRKWIVEDDDLIASLRYHRDGNLTVRQWINSLKGVQETAFFALDDPLPFAGVFARDAKRLLAKGLHALRSN